MRTLPRAMLAVIVVLAVFPVVLAVAHADPPTLEDLGDPVEGRLAYTEGFSSRSILARMDAEGDEQFHPLDEYGLLNAANSDYRAGVHVWSSQVDTESGTRRHIFALVDGEVVQLTDGNADHDNPAVSPDGEWVAYERYAAPDYIRHVRLVRADGTDDRPLTDAATVQTWPTWSADPDDGLEVAYVGGAGSAARLYKIAVDDTDAVPVRLSIVPVEHPAWSPDGERIAFVKQFYRGSAGWVREVVTVPSDLCEYNGPYGSFVGACVPQRIVYSSGWTDASYQPAWTPAGIAFVSRVDGGADRVYHLTSIDDDPVFEPVSPGRRAEIHPTWRDDLEAIEFTTAIAPIRIWTSQPDGSDAELYTADAELGVNFSPAYSPDGRELAYVVPLMGADFAVTGTAIRIDRLGDPLADPVILSPNEPEQGYSDPAFSPDGRYLAARHQYDLSVADADASPRVAEIVVFDLEQPDAPPTRLPHSSEIFETAYSADIYVSYDAGPSWSPDGGQIVFSRGWEFYDSIPEPEPEPSTSPSSSPSSIVVRQVGVVDPWSAMLYAVEFPFAAPLPRRLTGTDDPEDGRYDVTPAWSPTDPDTVVFSRDGQLWTVDPSQCLGGPGEPCDNAPLPVEGDIPELYSLHPAWSADGEFLAFASGYSDGDGGPFAPQYVTGYFGDATSIWVMPGSGGAADRITDEGTFRHWYSEPAWQPTADLSVHVEAVPDAVAVGETSTVVVTVSNLGRAATEASVEINLPPALPTAVVPDNCTPDGAVCQLERMPTRTQVQIELVVTGAAIGTHQVDVAVEGRVVDPDPSDNTASTSITVRPQPPETPPTESPPPSVPPPAAPPRLSVNAAVAPTPGFVGGDDLVVTFTVRNVSTVPAEAVRLTAQLPGELAPVSTTSGCASGADCGIGDIAAGASTTVVFTLPPVVAIEGTASVSVTALESGVVTAAAPVVVLQPEIKVNPGLGPPGRPTQVTGDQFPPGAVITVLWEQGLNGQPVEVTIAADGTFTTSLLVFGNDQLGPREVIAEPRSGQAFGPVNAPFLVVPGGLGPPDFIGRR